MQPPHDEDHVSNDGDSSNSYSDSKETIHYSGSSRLGSSSPRYHSFSSSTKSLVRKTRTLADVYERCSLIVLKPKKFDVASKYEERNVAMEEDIK